MRGNSLGLSSGSAAVRTIAHHTVVPAMVVPKHLPRASTADVAPPKAAFCATWIDTVYCCVLATIVVVGGVGIGVWYAVSHT